MSDLGDSLGEMSISDFAMGLIEEGKVAKDSNVVQPTGTTENLPTTQALPVADLDVREATVSDDMMSSILEGSFGIKQKETPQPVVEETTETDDGEGSNSLHEEVQTLKTQLRESIQDFTKILSRMFEIAEMTTTMSIGVNHAGPAKDPMKKKLKKARKGS